MRFARSFSLALTVLAAPAALVRAQSISAHDIFTESLRSNSSATVKATAVDANEGRSNASRAAESAEFGLATAGVATGQLGGLSLGETLGNGLFGFTSRGRGLHLGSLFRETNKGNARVTVVDGTLAAARGNSGANGNADDFVVGEGYAGNASSNAYGAASSNAQPAAAALEHSPAFATPSDDDGSSSDGVFIAAAAAPSQSTGLFVTAGAPVGQAGTLGTAVDPSDPSATAIVTATPEPSTLGLLATGVAGLFGVFTRRRAKNRTR